MNNNLFANVANTSLMVSSGFIDPQKSGISVPRSDSYTVTFNGNGEGGPILSISPDGTLKIYKYGKEKEIARIFWNMVQSEMYLTADIEAKYKRACNLLQSVIENNSKIDEIRDFLRLYNK